MNEDKVLEFWNQRANLGVKAGSDDYIGKELEINALAKHLKDGMQVAEFGCGNGLTAIELAKKFDIEISCYDFSPAMIDAAKENLENEKIKGKIEFKVASVQTEPVLGKSFDIVFTQRMVINLQSWSDQAKAIHYLTSILKNGGKYLMCENSMSALQNINEFRSLVDLEVISPPWHNLYLDDEKVNELEINEVRLLGVDAFMSTYYFLSRIVNAWLAKIEGKSPAYDAPVNQLAIRLPPVGDFSQTKLWVFEKY